MNGDLVLGIDGGGSKTLIALADGTGRIVATGRGEGVNPLDNGSWRQEFDKTVRIFAATPGLAAMAAALPAYGEVESISAEQRDAVTSVFGRLPQRLLNDVEAAQIGAFANGPGILVLSGTGSMAWARDSRGRSHRVGGWGDVIGDEGSGHWIGRRILSLVSQSLDGRADPTALAGALFEQLGLDSSDAVNGLEGWVSHLSHPRSQIAALAPLATRLAETGDRGARMIVEAAAEEIARHFTAIAHYVGPSADWSHAGGTLSSAVLRDAVAARIGRPPTSPRLPPIGGALLVAAQLADWSTDAAWIERLGASLSSAFDDHNEVQLTATA